MTIDPGFLAELDRFDSSLQRTSVSVRQGEQESPRVGEGLTFSDYRRYAPGDDIRLVDWKVYGRTEEFFIKQFEEERSLTVHVLLDASASMDFGEGDANKFEYAAKLGLGFAYLTAEEHNDFRFSTFGRELDRLDGGRSNRGEVLGLVDRLNEIEPAGETDFPAICEAYADRIDTRSLVLVVSDFLSPADEVEAGLAALSRNEVVLGHVLAPGERDPEVAGDVVFEEPETGEELRTYFGGRRVEGYRSRLQDHLDEVAARSDAFRADHHLVDTGEDFFESFGDLWLG